MFPQGTPVQEVRVHVVVLSSHIIFSKFLNGTNGYRIGHNNIIIYYYNNYYHHHHHAYMGCFGIVSKHGQTKRALSRNDLHAGTRDYVYAGVLFSVHYNITAEFRPGRPYRVILDVDGRLYCARSSGGRRSRRRCV